jgi:hypothetical protein
MALLTGVGELAANGSTWEILGRDQDVGVAGHDVVLIDPCRGERHPERRVGDPNLRRTGKTSAIRWIPALGLSQHQQSAAKQSMHILDAQAEEQLNNLPHGEACQPTM